MTGSFTKKCAASILLGLFVAISRFSSSEAGYTMNETCNYIKKGYIGDPTNCQNWGYCEGGQLVTKGICGAGLLFDSKISMCNYAKDVACLSTLEDACAVATEPGYIGDPNNCNRYCYCANRVPQYFNCPQYQVFNPEINKCVWSREYKCPANSICRLIRNNEFAGDPNICGNYIRCQDGSGISASCGEKLLFNPLLGSCDSSYSCDSNPGNEPGGNTAIPSKNETICSKYGSEATGIQYFSDDRTCYGYYSCDKKNAVGIWGSCPFATHFNPETQNCVTPYSYACPHDRCGNLNLSFVAQEGCKGYAVCSNQKTTSTDLCSEVNPGFGYFNEYGGGCVANKPDQAICETAETPQRSF